MFRTLDFRGASGTFIRGRKKSIKVCHVWLGPVRAVICGEHKGSEQQIVSARWGKECAK